MWFDSSNFEKILEVSEFSYLSGLGPKGLKPLEKKEYDR